MNDRPRDGDSFSGLIKKFYRNKFIRTVTLVLFITTFFGLRNAFMASQSGSLEKYHNQAVQAQQDGTYNSLNNLESLEGKERSSLLTFDGSESIKSKEALVEQKNHPIMHAPPVTVPDSHSVASKPNWPPPLSVQTSQRSGQIVPPKSRQSVSSSLRPPKQSPGLISLVNVPPLTTPVIMASPTEETKNQNLSSKIKAIKKSQADVVALPTTDKAPTSPVKNPQPHVPIPLQPIIVRKQTPVVSAQMLASTVQKPTCNVFSVKTQNRILVYGMQGSGASVFAYLLSQVPNTVSITSMFLGRQPPTPTELRLVSEGEGVGVLPSVVLQVYASQRTDLTSVVRRFKPHVTILFVRHPAACLASLSQKINPNKAGSPEIKVKAVEESLLLTNSALFTAFTNKTNVAKMPGTSSSTSSASPYRQLLALQDSLGLGQNLVSISDLSQLAKIDAVFSFEDLLTNHSATVAKLQCLGYSKQLIERMFAFPRTPEILADFTVKNSKWAEQERGNMWEFPMKRFKRELSDTGGILSEQQKQALLQRFYGRPQSELSLPPPPGGPHSFMLDPSKAIVNFDDKFNTQAQSYAPVWASYYKLKFPLVQPPKMGRRIFVYGLQSSGASLVAYSLAQKPNSVAIVDLWSSKSPPSSEVLNIKPGVSDVIVKVSVSSGEGEGGDRQVDLEDIRSHIQTFKPDLSVLVLRHPAVNLASLNSKTVRDFGGSMESKAKLLELTFSESFLRSSVSLFDEVVLYEDICLGIDSLVDSDNVSKGSKENDKSGGRSLLSALGYEMQASSPPAKKSESTQIDYSKMSHASMRRLFSRMGVTSIPDQDDMLKFPRSIEQVNDYAAAQCGWCGSNLKKTWGMKPANYAKFDNLKLTQQFKPPVPTQTEDSRYGVQRGMDRKVSKGMFVMASKLCPSMVSFYGQLPVHAHINDQGLGKRMLVFGLPHSGTSLFSFFLAQRPSAVAFINVYPDTQVPSPKELGLGADSDSQSSQTVTVATSSAYDIANSSLSVKFIRKLTSTMASQIESPDIVMKLPLSPKAIEIGLANNEINSNIHKQISIKYDRKGTTYCPLNSGIVCPTINQIFASITRFEADVSFLVLRHPAHIYASLTRSKNHVNAALDEGANESPYTASQAKQQLALLELLYSTHLTKAIFDQVVLYEDLVMNHDTLAAQLRSVALGDVDPRKLFRFERTQNEVLEFTLKQSSWAREGYQKKWDHKLNCLRGAPLQNRKDTTDSMDDEAPNTSKDKQSFDELKPQEGSDKNGQSAISVHEKEADGGDVVMLRQNVLKASAPTMEDFQVASQECPMLYEMYADRFPELSKGQGRRFLVYALQASGGTIFTHLLAQTPGSIGVLDLWASKPIPSPTELEVSTTTDVVIKAVVTNKFTISQHIETFQPDIKILFLRHPAHALSALRRRDYAKKTGTGTLDTKLQLFEDAFVNQVAYGFDVNVTYEELVDVSKDENDQQVPNPKLVTKLKKIGFTTNQITKMFRFERSADEVRSFNMKTSSWCRKQAGTSWEVNSLKRSRMGVGFTLSRDHVEQFPTPSDHSKAMALAPMLYGWYKVNYPELSARSGKRVFVYGMQSSGASTFLLLLAQLERSIGIIDLYVGRPAPEPSDFDLSISPYVFLKGTVNKNISVDEYIETFQPDIKLLFVRHPEHNLASLKKKFYAPVAGSMDEKFAVLEDAYKRREKLFDEVILYEEMVLNRPVMSQKLQGVGFSKAEVDTMFAFQRSLKEITKFSIESSVWCRANHRLLWDVGNFHGDQSASNLLNKDYLDRHPTLEDRARSYKNAPQLTSFYRERYQELGPSGISQATMPAMNQSECDPRGGMCEGSASWDDKAMGGGDPAFAELVEDLMVMVRERARSNRIVFVMASADWQNVLMNWICRLEQIGFYNYIVLAADDELYNSLHSVHAPVFRFAIKRKDGGFNVFHQQMWLYRWRVMSEVVKRGYDVLHSDADAVWIGDPSAILNLQVDIIASRGSPEPDWLLCMGYVYIRSTPSTLEFLPRFIKRLIDVKDDQRAFNLVLKYGYHLTWNKNPFIRSSFKEVIVGSIMKPPMQVVLLPNNIARRFGCEPGSMSGSEIVVHCREVGNVGMTQKETSDTKARGLSVLGLWVLKNNWRDELNPTSWNSYIGTICMKSRL